jgi:molybdopterin/thiamine biosynthesis adenylyltransferase
MPIDISRHSRVFDAYSFEVLHDSTTVFGTKPLGSHIAYLLAKLGLTRISIRSAGYVSSDDRCLGMYRAADYLQLRSIALGRNLFAWTGETYECVDTLFNDARCDGAVVFITTGTSTERLELVENLTQQNQKVRLIIDISTEGTDGCIKCIPVNDQRKVAEWKEWRKLRLQSVEKLPLISTYVALASLAVWQLINFNNDCIKLAYRPTSESESVADDLEVRDVTIDLAQCGLFPSDLSSLLENDLSIVGLGAIGSHLAYQLIKLQLAGLLAADRQKVLCAFDFDTIEQHNIANQIFALNDIGRTKTSALSQILYEESPLNSEPAICDAYLLTLLERVQQRSQLESRVCFLAVDSKEVRANLAMVAQSSNQNQIIIETGIGDTFGNVTTFSPKNQRGLDKFIRYRTGQTSTNGRGCNATISAGPVASLAAALAVGKFIQFCNQRSQQAGSSDQDFTSLNFNVGSGIIDVME